MPDPPPHRSKTGPGSRGQLWPVYYPVKEVSHTNPTCQRGGLSLARRVSVSFFLAGVIVGVALEEVLRTTRDNQRDNQGQFLQGLREKDLPE